MCRGRLLVWALRVPLLLLGGGVTCSPFQGCPSHGPGPVMAPLCPRCPTSVTAGVGEIWAPAPLPPVVSAVDGPLCAPEDSVHSHVLGGRLHMLLLFQVGLLLRASGLGALGMFIVICSHYLCPFQSTLSPQIQTQAC